MQINIKHDADREVFFRSDRGDLAQYELDLMIDGLEASIREVILPGSGGIARGAVMLDGFVSREAIEKIEELSWVDGVAVDMLDDIGAILLSRGSWYYGDVEELEEVALDWRGEGFDADGVEAWTALPIEDPRMARSLEEKEIFPRSLEALAGDLVEVWLSPFSQFLARHGRDSRALERETIRAIAELVVDRGFSLEDAREELTI